MPQGVPGVSKSGTWFISYINIIGEAELCVIDGDMGWHQEICEIMER